MGLPRTCAEAGRRCLAVAAIVAATLAIAGLGHAQPAGDAPPGLRLIPPDLAAAAPPESGIIWVRIVFDSGQENLAPVYDVLLQRLTNELDTRRGQRLRLRAYAGGADAAAARRTALARAMAVRRRLIAMGVDGQWIELRALGTLGAALPPDRVDVVVLPP